MRNAVKNRRNSRVNGSSDTSPTDAMFPPLPQPFENAKDKKGKKTVASPPEPKDPFLAELLGKLHMTESADPYHNLQEPEGFEGFGNPNPTRLSKPQAQYGGFGRPLLETGEPEIQNSPRLGWGVLNEYPMAGFSGMLTSQPPIGTPARCSIMPGTQNDFKTTSRDTGKQPFRPVSFIPDRVDLPHERFRNIYSNISQPYSQAFGVPDVTEDFRTYPEAISPAIHPNTLPESTLRLPDNHWTELMPYSQANMRPSEMMLRERGLIPDKPHPGAKEKEETVPDEENCSLWLKYIPQTITHGDIFRLINCGAVYSLHIYPAVGQHTTQAAKLIFMKPSGAATFLRNHMRHCTVLHGRRITVEYNRDGVRQYDGIQTRVLRIQGPEEGRAFAFWDQYIEPFCMCYFEVAYAPCSIPGETIFDLRFARVDGQAQMVMKSIRQDPALQHLRVSYGPDPCDPSSIQPFVFPSNP